MKSRTLNPIAFALLLGAGLFLAACEEDPAIQLNSNFAVGGYTYYDLGNDSFGTPTFLVRDVPVAGVSVTLTAAEGSVDSATSGADGYYEVRGLRSGSYTINVTAPGYQPLEGVVGLSTTDDFTEFNFKMDETLPTMTVTWGTVSVTLEDLDVRQHGIEGVSAAYSTAAHSTIVVTYSLPMTQGTYSDLNTIGAGSLDATQQVRTISEASVDGLTGLGTNTLDVGGCWLTPIHATSNCVNATLIYTKGA